MKEAAQVRGIWDGCGLGVVLHGNVLADVREDMCRVGTSRVSRDDDDFGDLWFFG
jgi:hypothetical protein